MTFTISHAPPPQPDRPLDKSLREYLDTHADAVVNITRKVSIDDVGALSAQVDDPIVFHNIAEHPQYRLTDIHVKNRVNQARALGVKRENYIKTLAYRLRQPARGFNIVKSGPAKEIVRIGDQVNWLELPIPKHKDVDKHPYVTAMNIVKDPETGFYNTSHSGTYAVEPRLGLPSFITPHTNAIIRKYRDLGMNKMPMVFAFGLPPAYEIMGNYSGLHMDMWGELEMIGTIMDQDIDMVPCESIDMYAPAQAEIIVEGEVNIDEVVEVGEVTSPSMYHLPHVDRVSEFRISAMTMREDRPIYRNHQTCPDTDHQPLPRLCHEAILYNRLTEMGLQVKDVQFPTWGGALSCLLQFDYPMDGFVNDALLCAMGAPWLNTKMVVALSPDTDIEDAREVYHAIASRVDPEKDVLIIPHTRGSLFDPSASPIEGRAPFRTVGKMGIDATVKSRHDPHDFDRAWPKNWGKVRIEDYQ